MDIMVWMLAGGVVGWVSWGFLGFKEERGMQVSVPGDFSTSGLLFAAAVAAAFLAIGNLLDGRWGG